MNRLHLVSILICSFFLTLASRVSAQNEVKDSILRVDVSITPKNAPDNYIRVVTLDFIEEKDSATMKYPFDKNRDSLIYKFSDRQLKIFMKENRIFANVVLPSNRSFSCGLVYYGQINGKGAISIKYPQGIQQEDQSSNVNCLELLILFDCEVNFRRSDLKTNSEEEIEESKELIKNLLKDN